MCKGVITTQRRRGKTEQDTWMVKIKTKIWLDELARRAGDSPDLKQELEDKKKDFLKAENIRLRFVMLM